MGVLTKVKGFAWTTREVDYKIMNSRTLDNDHPTSYCTCKNHPQKHSITQLPPQNHAAISRHIPFTVMWILLSEIWTFPSLICLPLLNPCYGGDGNLTLYLAKMILLDSSMLTRVSFYLKVSGETLVWMWTAVYLHSTFRMHLTALVCDVTRKPFLALCHRPFTVSS